MDETAIARMESRLDPELPPNQKKIVRLNAGWDRQEVFKRLSAPKLLGLGLVTLIPFMAVLGIAGSAVGLQGAFSWSGFITIVLSAFLVRAICDQVRRGRMQWLLRRETDSVPQ